MDSAVGVENRDAREWGPLRPLVPWLLDRVALKPSLIRVRPQICKAWIDLSLYIFAVTLPFTREFCTVSGDCVCCVRTQASRVFYLAKAIEASCP